VSCFLFSVTILRTEWLTIIVRGKFSPGLNCVVYIFMVLVSLHYLKNRLEIKQKKQVFSTESKERHYYLKQTEIIPYVKRTVPFSMLRSLR